MISNRILPYWRKSKNRWLLQNTYVEQGNTYKERINCQRGSVEKKKEKEEKLRCGEKEEYNSYKKYVLLRLKIPNIF